jgi:hypothetical protein
VGESRDRLRIRQRLRIRDPGRSQSQESTLASGRSATISPEIPGSVAIWSGGLLTCFPKDQQEQQRKQQESGVNSIGRNSKLMCSDSRYRLIDNRIERRDETVVWFCSDEAERDALCWVRILKLELLAHQISLLSSPAAIFPPSSSPPFAVALHSSQGTLFALLRAFSCQGVLTESWNRSRPSFSRPFLTSRADSGHSRPSLAGSSATQSACLSSGDLMI